MNRSSRVLVAGDDTLAGAALLEALAAAGHRAVTGARGEELADAGRTEDLFGEARPEYVFLVAGKSGGIGLNSDRPAELMLNNLLVAAHVLRAAHEHGVRKLLYLASSCAYPREAPQPLRVESLMTGPLEPTSEAYATAKLAGWALCRAYRRQHGCNFVTAIPANAFGPHDDFSPEGGHVIPGLMRRAHEARRRGEPALTVWGTGRPRREFLFSRDLADACLYLMRRYDGEAPINVGGGADLEIAAVARAVAGAVGFAGAVRFDPTRPDGAPLKALDSTPLHALGWRPSVPFAAALAETYRWFQEHVAKEAPTHGRATVPGAVPHPAH
jgi:GDP-L-fucose synthase